MSLGENEAAFKEDAAAAGGGLKTEGEEEPLETTTEETAEDTCVYRDFATIPAPALGGAALHPQSLQAQKLPAKLVSMLSDPDLAPAITWLPHGRSWRVLNRDLFSEHALPRFFGHKNFASFVRIVNAWGFHRITRGPDRDSYYHELFLRARPDLHQRMKRVSSKTPTKKEDKCPDFYQLAKTSPLPEVTYQRPGQGMLVSQTRVPGPVVASGGPSLGNSLGSLNPQILSLLRQNDARSMNPDNAQSSLPRLAQLQRDNEDLRRRIMDLESTMGQGRQVPDQLAALSANIGNGANNHRSSLLGSDSSANDVLERMQRDFTMRSGASSMGGGASGLGGGGSEFSFMTGFPRQEMLLRAMRLENQMGLLDDASSLELCALHSKCWRAFPFKTGPAGGAGPVSEEDRMKALMEWISTQQKNGSSA